jgi:hypothetical protein
MHDAACCLKMHGECGQMHWLLPTNNLKTYSTVLCIHGMFECVCICLPGRLHVEISNALFSHHAVTALTSSRDLSMNPSLSVASRCGQRSRKQCHLPAESAHTMYSLQQCTARQPHSTTNMSASSPYGVAAADLSFKQSSPSHCCSQRHESSVLSWVALLVKLQGLSNPAAPYHTPRITPNFLLSLLEADILLHTPGVELLCQHINTYG